MNSSASWHQTGTESYIELENYFDFVEKDVIRIKGNRIDIEIVLEDYLEGASPEEILLRYPTLNLEKIHATILYYLAKKIDLIRLLAPSLKENSV